MDESKFHIIEGRTFCVPCGREARTIELFTSTDYHCDYCEANPGSFDDDETTETWPGRLGPVFFIGSQHRAISGRERVRRYKVVVDGPAVELDVDPRRER